MPRLIFDHNRTNLMQQYFVFNTRSSNVIGFYSFVLLLHILTLGKRYVTAKFDWSNFSDFNVITYYYRTNDQYETHNTNLGPLLPTIDLIYYFKHNFVGGYKQLTICVNFFATIPDIILNFCTLIMQLNNVTIQSNEVNKHYFSNSIKQTKPT